MSAAVENDAEDLLEKKDHKNPVLSGHIYIFHAFDVGDDINLSKIALLPEIITRPLQLPKYFKHHGLPLEIELPHPNNSAACESVKIHTFGAISLTYKIPFHDTLQNIRNDLVQIDNKFQEQSIIDTGSIIKKIKTCIKKPNFFHTKSSYVVIQLDQTSAINTSELTQDFNSTIASIVRFENAQLSEYQKNHILNDVMGNFKGDLIVIDIEAAFVYDPDYENILHFFEFANIQQLELHYFDRLLDKQLKLIYEEQTIRVPLTAYIPFVGSRINTPIDELGRLKVDISVITEQLENNIRLAGEPFYFELYQRIVKKMALAQWKDSIQTKLEIIHEIRSQLQHKVDTARGDMLEVLIVILIFIELILGIIAHFK